MPSGPAHPRRCGENDGQVVERGEVTGSSPQVRGKLVYILHAVVPLRLIPAGAGKTCESWNSAVDTPAHPRRCGENTTYTGFASAFPGSSPQVRGKHRVLVLVGVVIRLIPAGAGKTSRF